MSLPILHFAHANSYPAGTYGMFFEQLRRHYDVRALAMHAHNPRYPVDDGWRKLTRELVEELEKSYREPVILVGHSMGGILSLMAARKRPDLARCVVLLDSPVVAGWRAQLLRAAKFLRYESKRSPAMASVKRRNAWPDMEAAYQHYAAKAMFAAWPQRVLRDYVEHGIEPHEEGGVRLRFTREAETAVYRTIPHHLGCLTRRPYPVPIGFVGGTDSVECRLAGLDATRRLVGTHFRQIPGGHLFPMESPAAAAEAAHQMIAELLKRDARQN
ncbi:alpha/beta fold hydrolase [Herbaspirillum robiniae]|uniref:Alpha/beta hydrolase n=1 Tax=Herbaspirillum robiniae TaxID=2014887 RepID=A0A2D0B657_9BURK|nr:alpha/beta hydrolase [Herbaspirillum robiniae]NUU01833.1 alpha/beta hydrolase [Herbaspirillum robiniae]OWY29789.1 alpha/beta hydrolase [Herbaspirillum robiniae]